MHIERALRGIAGFFILLSLTLSQIHSTYWLLFTAFVGLNLLQSAATDWCPMVWMLQKAGMNRCGENASSAETSEENG